MYLCLCLLPLQLADFGLSCCFSPLTQRSEPSAYIWGTPGYVSPLVASELALAGQVQTAPADDVYSAGATLLQLLLRRKTLPWMQEEVMLYMREPLYAAHGWDGLAAWMDERMAVDPCAFHDRLLKPILEDAGIRVSTGALPLQCHMLLLWIWSQMHLTTLSHRERCCLFSSAGMKRVSDASANSLSQI